MHNGYSSFTYNCQDMKATKIEYYAAIKIYELSSHKKDIEKP